MIGTGMPVGIEDGFSGYCVNLLPDMSLDSPYLSNNGDIKFWSKRALQRQSVSLHCLRQIIATFRMAAQAEQFRPSLRHQYVGLIQDVLDAETSLVRVTEMLRNTVELQDKTLNSLQ